MTRNMSISDTGLRLIKAFEGFRPTDRELVTGARVIGYGHRLYSDMPMTMTKQEAEDRLKVDLASYEELVNEEVHAPLTQSQFDALCSLAFNIGPKAFRQCDTVRALNNGRVLDAANGFDIWRKAKIGGKTYVVDALMRRRSAEKSLFLRTEQPLPAPTAMLEPVQDPSAPLGPTEDSLPTFSEEDAEGLVANATYEVTPDPDRHHDDDLLGAMTHSEIQTDEGEDEVEDESSLSSDTDVVLADDEADEPDEVIESVETPIIIDPLDEMDEPILLTTVAEADDEDEEDDESEDRLAEPVSEDIEAEDKDEERDENESSPISDAADDISARLNKLLDTDKTIEASDEENWPSSLIGDPIGTEDETSRSNLVAFPNRTLVQEDGSEPEDASRIKRDDDGRPVVIDNLAADDAIRASTDPEDPVYDPDGDPVENATRYLERMNGNRNVESSGKGLWIPLIIGSALIGASAVMLGRGATSLLNSWGPIAVLAAAITGGLMVLFALYAVARSRLS